MTAQICERLTYENNTSAMATEPLRLWLSRRKNRHLRFKPRTTACRRGYVGIWEIVGDRLYLLSLSAALLDGTPVTLADLFPDSRDRVFAEWYSGELYCPTGGLLSYVHAGYESVYEYGLFLQIEKGVLVSQRIQKNDPPESDLFDETDLLDI